MRISENLWVCIKNLWACILQIRLTSVCFINYNNKKSVNLASIMKISISTSRFLKNASSGWGSKCWPGLTDCIPVIWCIFLLRINEKLKPCLLWGVRQRLLQTPSTFFSHRREDFSNTTKLNCLIHFSKRFLQGLCIYVLV